MLSRHLLQNLLHKIHERRGRSRYVFKYKQSGNQVYHGTLSRKGKKKKKRKHEIPQNFLKKKNQQSHVKHVKAHKLCTNFQKHSKEKHAGLASLRTCAPAWLYMLFKLNKKNKIQNHFQSYSTKITRLINKCNSLTYSGNTTVPFQSNASPCCSTTPYTLSTTNNEILNRQTLPQMHNTENEETNAEAVKRRETKGKSCIKQTKEMKGKLW